MGRDMPDSWSPVANVKPERSAIRLFLSADVRAGSLETVWCNVKWARRRATRVTNSADVGKRGVYDGIAPLAKAGPVVEADRNAVRTAIEKKVMVATRERGDRRDTPQRK